MRNVDSNSSVTSGDDDWTVPTTITETTESSFVDVGQQNQQQQQVLQVKVSPRNESIGFFSSVKTTQVCVNIKACELSDDQQRSPVDIINALDISGSMQGGKLRDCKKTIELQLRNLTSKDRFGLVTYGSVCKVEIPPMFMTEDNKKRALRKLKSICVNGMTNLSGGLALAAQEMQLISTPNPVQSIFLLTDGHANQGITDIPSLVSMVQNFNKQQQQQQQQPPNQMMSDLQIDDNDDNASTHSKPTSIVINQDKAPISVFCFGYGSDHNSDMLRAISEASAGGGYYFVENDSDVSSAFGDAMGGLLSVVAQSTTIRLSVSPNVAAKGVKILKVHHKDHMERDDGSFTVNVGDFYAEESRDVLLDVELSNAPSETAVPHVSVMVTYMDALKKASAAVGPMECSIVRPANDELSPIDMHIEAQRLRIHVAEEMESANRAANQNDLEGARSQMRQMIDRIQVSPAYQTEQVHFLRSMATEAEEVLEGFSSIEKYNKGGGHLAKSKGAMFRTQRCFESNEASMSTFRSTKKATFAKKMKRAFKTS